MIQLRIIKRGHQPALSGWALDAITKVLIRESKKVKREEGNVKMEAEIGVMHFEDGRRGHKSRDIGGHWKLKKAR